MKFSCLGNLEHIQQTWEATLNKSIEENRWGVLLNVGVKEEVATVALLDNIIKAWLIDGECLAVLDIDAVRGDVNHDNLNIWALQSNHGHGGATHITSTQATDLHHFDLNLDLKKNEVFRY
ncbi:hypothetical protein LUZ62_057125 [Rhynchospora pubera]|uniref:Uncharacterized protein n=1 Tax=Rhynchospora pubera TaxID=906938 RepID=A0AAV8E2Z3_9POAL|nr:hypothetical protein LUZ62_057125 [Rhynchospora pubera]